MSPSAHRSETATVPPSPTVGAPRPGMPHPRERDGSGDPPPMDDEGGWAAGIDRLLLRVTDDLRHAGVELPDTRLRGVAERLVLEAAHFVLDWVETPTGARPAPALLERGSGS